MHTAATQALMIARTTVVPLTVMVQWHRYQSDCTSSTYPKQVRVLQLSTAFI